ncbi:MAG: VCBS repeat-containing protein [Candidatus Kapabacteria bacterium]|nr:VCBS repeat-containing protein [Candidatus Kapabacteria bacterium]
MKIIVAIVVIMASVAGGFAITRSRSDNGAELADKYCVSCHLKPLPEHLDKSTWVAKVFPVMRQYLGMDQIPQRDKLPHDLQAFYPTFPAMTEDEWFSVAQWYIDNAPAVLPSPVLIDVKGVTSQFQSMPLRKTIDVPMTTVVRFDAQRRRMIIGDGFGNALHVLNMNGDSVASVSLNGPPSSVDVQPDAWYVTDMGKLLPHDSAIGRLVKITWVKDVPTSTVILDSLRRPTSVTVADLNGDSRKDYLVCEYGNLIGRFGWYEIDAKGRSKYHELVAQPGAIRAELRDVNGDKRLDIVVLMAQAREGLVAYINNGKGRYTARELITFPPCYGSSSFSFYDVDDDGKLEIIITTGDNGDYEDPPFKPYHGVYIYGSDKNGVYTQRSFQHLDGAYGAFVRDFDSDGTQDMLSFSFFPRLDRSDVDLIRFDFNVGRANMNTWRVAHAADGRWLASDIADADGDGDLDVLLGNVSMGPGRIPNTVQDRWMSGGVVALYLKNTTK